MKRIALLCVLALALCAIATANIIPTMTGVTGGGSLWTWTYDFQLSADQDALVGLAPTVNPVGNTTTGLGAFVTIYDFAGYIPGTCVGPAGWTCTAQLVGYTPILVNPTDNGGLYNLTWAHTTGSNILGAPTNGVDLGTNFQAQSTIGLSTMTAYATRAVSNFGTSAGTITSNVGNTLAPNPVPEPATLALIGAGLVGLGLLRRRARKS